MQTRAATVENIMDVPPKVKNRTTIWSSNSTTWYLLEEYENTNSERYMHPYSIIYKSQIMEST